MDERHDEMLSKIRQGAVRAFGEEAGQRWLVSNSRMFGGRSPSDMALREDGARQVLDFVTQLTAAEDSWNRSGIRNNDN